MSSSDIITVLYLACVGSTAVGGAHQAPPTEGCLQTTTGGADTRLVTTHKKRPDFIPGIFHWILHIS